MKTLVLIIALIDGTELMRIEFASQLTEEKCHEMLESITGTSNKVTNAGILPECV